MVRRIPPPKGDPEAPLQALIIDSWFDAYVGVCSLVRVVKGASRSGPNSRHVDRSRLADRQARAAFGPSP